MLKKQGEDATLISTIIMPLPVVNPRDGKFVIIYILGGLWVILVACYAWWVCWGRYRENE